MSELADNEAGELLLLRAELQGAHLRGAVDGIRLHLVGHVRILDDCLTLRHLEALPGRWNSG